MVIISGTSRILLFSIFGAVLVHALGLWVFVVLVPPAAPSVSHDTDLSVRISAIRADDQSGIATEKRESATSQPPTEGRGQNKEDSTEPNTARQDSSSFDKTSSVEIPQQKIPYSQNTAVSIGATDSVVALIASKVQANLRYPQQARRRGAQGTVRLSLLLRNDGHAINIHISTGSGSTILDSDAQALLASVLPVAVPDNFPFERPILIAIQYQLN